MRDMLVEGNPGGIAVEIFLYCPADVGIGEQFEFGVCHDAGKDTDFF